MKIKVKNKNYNESISILDFRNGVAEVDPKNEKRARQIAQALNFEVIEDKPKTEHKAEPKTKSTTTRKRSTRKSSSK